RRGYRRESGGGNDPLARRAQGQALFHWLRLLSPSRAVDRAEEILRPLSARKNFAAEQSIQRSRGHSARGPDGKTAQLWPNGRGMSRGDPRLLRVDQLYGRATRQSAQRTRPARTLGQDHRDPLGRSRLAFGRARVVAEDEPV